MDYTNIIDCESLRDLLENPDLVIIDCRFQLGQPEKGLEDYQKGHLPNAIYLDLEKDLSGPIREHGGRHPLPSIDEMVQTFSEIGINSTKKVVAYDDQGGAMASRLWWILKYLGHKNVMILNGGYTSWKNKGFPVTTKVSELPKSVFIADIQEEMLATMEEVKSKLHKDDVIFIDSRAEERYTGEKEEIDPVAGHIPGAVVENWQNRISSDGSWKPKAEQEVGLSNYKDCDKELIVYCGSGVTACPNILALVELGLKPKLYGGSWSDWITYKDNPIETGKL